jgi:ribosomal protein L35
MRSHNLEKKSSKRRRGFRKLDEVVQRDVKRVQKILRGG